MDFDKKDVSSYLDGIQLKISSAFIPPPPIVLPPLLNAEEWTPEKFHYDFSLEKKALECINQMKEEKVKKIPKPKNTCNKQQNPVPSNMHTLFSSDILLPKTKENSDKVSNSEEISSSKINLSDFENDMSSPFDYMELQTINDLEELSSVFQGLHAKYNNSDAKEKDSNQNSSATPSVTKSMSFPLESSDCSFLESSSELAALKENCLPPCSDDLQVEEEEEGAFPYPQQALSTVLPKVPFFACPTFKNPDRQPGLLRVCKSYSDIHDLTTNHSSLSESKPGRSCTPPVMDTTTIPKTPSVQEEEEEESVETVNDNCDKQRPGLPDPYDELPDEDRKFVDAIADMGFPRAQVSRTVRHLGRDEKMVVEHLCQIQSLEESGYDCQEAEAALHLHDYKQDQAKKFLDLIIKFQDLGFEKDAVKKALIQNKNDWSKTIDALLS